MFSSLTLKLSILVTLSMGLILIVAHRFNDTTVMLIIGVLAAMLLCDKVLGLVQADEAAFKKLPYSIGQMAQLVDAVLPDAATGQLLFHLKPGILQFSNTRSSYAYSQ